MIFVLLLATGCFRNPCQQLCNDIQDFAKDCGYEFSPDQLHECYQNHHRSDLPDGVKMRDCRTIAPDIEEEWTCEDFQAYFDSPPPADDTAG
jgi:hypothetical protein